MVKGSKVLVRGVPEEIGRPEVQEHSEFQNLKRSMKCWGETEVRQLSGSFAVQGCPESCDEKRERSKIRFKALKVLFVH